MKRKAGGITGKSLQERRHERLVAAAGCSLGRDQPDYHRSLSVLLIVGPFLPETQSPFSALSGLKAASSESLMGVLQRECRPFWRWAGLSPSTDGMVCSLPVCLLAAAPFFLKQESLGGQVATSVGLLKRMPSVWQWELVLYS